MKLKKVQNSEVNLSVALFSLKLVLKVSHRYGDGLLFVRDKQSAQELT